ncbi:MAG: hypothetical protein KC620_05800 [Myxococcales bacterium]|nr:hypothetical protein [Myxococcales bacterium]
MDDLCVICPGGHWKAVMEALLERHLHLGIREITSEVIAFPLGRDRLLRARGPDLARLQRDRFHHCLIVLDADRSGEDADAAAIEESLNRRLAEVWSDSGARALVAEPSVEGWLLEGHRVFSRVRGLRGVDVRQWLAERDLWALKADLPDDPRAVVEALFLAHGARPSAANYRLIADEAPIRLDRCQATSFRRMVHILREWFLP